MNLEAELKNSLLDKESLVNNESEPHVPQKKAAKIIEPEQEPEQEAEPSQIISNSYLNPYESNRSK